MKKFGKKAKIVLVAVLSVLMVLCGVTAFAPTTTAKAEENLNVQTVSTDWYELSYSEHSLSLLISDNFREYLDANKSEVGNLVSGLVSAVKEIIMGNILSSGPVAMKIAPIVDIPSIDESFWNDANLSGTLKEFKDYVIDRLSNPDELDSYLNGEYNMLLEYAIGTYVESQQKDGALGEEELNEIYEKIEGAIDEVVGEAIVKAEEKVLIAEAQATFGENATQQQIDEYVSSNKGAYATEWKEKSEVVLKENVTSVKENGGSTPSIGISDLIAAFKGISVNGTDVYTKKDGISKSGLAAILAIIPRPNEIANMTAEQLKNLLNADIALQTTFGDIEFSLTFGFFGDTKVIQKAASAIAQVIDVTLSGNDLDVTINVPEVVSDAFLKLTETSKISDELKNKIFTLFGMTGGEMIDKATSYSFEELLEYAKSIDYQRWFNAFLNGDAIYTYFNNYLGSALNVNLDKGDIDRIINALTSYAQRFADRGLTYDDALNFLSNNVPGFSAIAPKLEIAKLENAVNKLLGIFNRIDWAKYDAETVRDILANSTTFNDTVYSYIEKFEGYGNIYDTVITYVEKLAAYLPESIKNGSLVDMYDGNGVFSHEGSYTLDLAKVIDKVASVLKNRGYESIANFVSNLVYVLGDTEYTLDLALTINVPDVYKVEYVVDGEVARAGFLPVGATVERFAPSVENVLFWVDGNGNVVTNMANADVTLYAVKPFEVEAYVDGKVGDSLQAVYGEAHTLKVAAERVSGLDYKWYYNGVIIEGATAESLQVVNVADSGEYKVVVSNKYETKEYVFNVVIEKATYDLSGVKFENKTVTYNGTEFEVVIDGELPTGVTVSYTNNKGTNVGEYNAVATFDYDRANYNAIEDMTATLTIEKATYDLSGVKFENKTVTYNGPEFEVVIDGELPTGVTVSYTNNKGTNVGEYNAVATFDYDRANYNAIEDMTATLTIEKAVITVDVVWNYTEPFVYDGTMKSVSYELDLIDSELDVDDVFTSYTVIGTSDGINAGEFMAIASYVYNQDNFDITVANDTLIWVIEKAKVTEPTNAWSEEEYAFVVGSVNVSGIVYEGATDKFSVSEVVYKDAAGAVVNNITTASVGAYTANVTVTLIDTNNYEVEGTLLTSFEFAVSIVIESAPVDNTIDLSGASWYYNGVKYNASSAASITYSGNEIVLTIGGVGAEVLEKLVYVYYDEDGVEISGKPVNVGTYFVEVRAAEGYELTNAPSQARIVISKKTVDAPANAWSQLSYTYVVGSVNVSEIVYNGANSYYSVSAVVFKDAQGNEVSDLASAEVGEYTANVTVTLIDATNVTVRGNANKTVFELSVAISIVSPASTPVDLSGASWQYNGSEYTGAEIEYTGSAIELTVGGVDVANSVTIVYYDEGKNKLNGAPVNAGTYYVEVVAKPGYIIVGDGLESIEIVISKAKVALPNVTLSDAVYDQGVWNVTVNVAGSNDYTYTYEGDLFAVVAGTYTVVVTFRLTNVFNYTFDASGLDENGVINNNGEYVVTLSWIVEEIPPIVPGETYVSGNVEVFDAESNVAEDHEINVSYVDFEYDEYKDIVEEYFGDVRITLGDVYDIHFVNEEDSESSVTGKFIVTIVLSDELKSLENASYVVMHILDDGSVEFIEATIANGKITFETTGFSLYAIFGIRPMPAPVGDWWLIALVCVIALGVIGAVALLVFKKDEEQPVLPSEPEQKDEEPVAEEKAEEPAVEEPVAEEKAEEPAVEEPAVEEKAEEPIVEEPAVEEKAEEPAVEEPAVEEKAEEPIVEEPVAETTATEEVAFEPTYTYDKSFAGKLAQSPEGLKVAYSEIKNHALAYRKIGSRMSWKFDSINRGRTKIAKLQIKGSSIIMYVAVDPDSISKSKYHHKSVKEKARFAEIPTKLKIKSMRSVKYAKELIDLAMAEKELKLRKEFNAVNYVEMYPYMTTEELVENKLAKAKLAQNRSFWNK